MVFDRADSPTHTMTAYAVRDVNDDMRLRVDSVHVVTTACGGVLLRIAALQQTPVASQKGISGVREHLG